MHKMFDFTHVIDPTGAILWWIICAIATLCIIYFIVSCFLDKCFPNQGYLIPGGVAVFCSIVIWICPGWFIAAVSFGWMH
jgi:hypothetical protein